MYYISYGASFTEDNSTFIIPWSVQILPALLMFFGLFFVPRSPRWLASKDRWDEALQVLADLHGKGNNEAPLVQAEYTEIRETIEVDRALADVRWKELVHRDNIQRITARIFVSDLTKAAM